jgi:hypothetical protein
MKQNPHRKFIFTVAICVLMFHPNLSAQEVSEKPAGYTADQVIESLLQAKIENRIPEGLKLLSEELDRRARHGNFRSLFSTVWTEAQVKSGRLDADWAAMLYDEIFKGAIRNEKYAEMNDVTGNLLTTLNAAGRHGRLSEVLDWWIEKQNGNQLLEITAYQDQGSVHPFFPEIRRRNTPASLLHSQIGIEPDNRRNMVDIEQKNGQVFALYATHLSQSGKWRESMEWVQQIRRWASLEDGNPRWQMIQPWFSSVESTAKSLQCLGYTQEALEQVDIGLAAPMQNSYHGRCNIILSLLRLEILMELKQAPEDLVEQARELVKRAEANTHLSISFHRNAKVTLARTLLHQGEDAEALALLDELAAVGNINARNVRVEYWIDKGMLDRVEEELLSLLKASRISGNKFSECNLYEKYADFLELSGRLSEALSMRREVIRLCNSFDYFTKLPTQLAKLAILLERMGDLDGSKAAADEARALLVKGRLPASRKNLAESFLAKLNPGKIVTEIKPEEIARVDFQPERSIVIPIEGRAWTTILSLANPSDKPEEGTLSARGIPVTFSREAEHGDVVVRPATTAEQGKSTLRIRLEPSNYQLIKITADKNFSKQGELALIWTSWRGETKVEANVLIEAPEKGVSSSVIQAGNYRANPFYGVPVHLHYVTTDQATQSSPLRFITSEKARVEVYALDGTPLSVDGQGNGSLRDKGDELFGTSDREGNLLLSLTDSAASFMVLVYPNGPLPEDGLTLNVEAFQDGAWSLHSQNRLQP